MYPKGATYWVRGPLPKDHLGADWIIFTLFRCVYIHVYLSMYLFVFIARYIYIDIFRGLVGNKGK